MRLTKFILAVVGATVLLGALVSSASARNLSITTRSINASWTRLSFRGGLGTVECEVILNGTGHSNTIVKSANALVGFITAANITRCARGGMTILRETLPWHRQYESFVNPLPNITAIRTRVIGFAMRWTEPVFGVSCLMRSSTTEPLFLTYNRTTATGALTSAVASGSIRCGEFNAVLEGTSSSITAHTVTLI